MKYRKGYKYQLAADYTFPMFGLLASEVTIDTLFIRVTNAGLLIREGYAWDGPSGPTIDTDDFMEASLVHDALYQLIRRRLLPYTAKSKADKLLYILCKRAGMPWWRRGYTYLAVRWFGKGAATDAKPVFTV